MPRHNGTLSDVLRVVINQIEDYKGQLVIMGSGQVSASSVNERCSVVLEELRVASGRLRMIRMAVVSGDASGAKQLLDERFGFGPSSPLSQI